MAEKALMVGIFFWLASQSWYEGMAEMALWLLDLRGLPLWEITFK